MHYMDILDRLEAIIEDDFARSVPSSLWDELDSFFDKDELAQFKTEVANEFDVEADTVFVDTVDFKDLLIALGATHIPEKDS